MNEITMGNATMFCYASDLLAKRMNEGVTALSSGNLSRDSILSSQLVVPVIVNASFACELFLKSILPPDTRGHKLQELFSALSNDLQNEIMELTISNMKDTDSDYSIEQFQQDLEKNSNNFAEWRYFHEGHSHEANLHFIVSLSSVLSHIASQQKMKESFQN